MDQLLANADELSRKLFETISHTLLVSGLVAAFFVSRHHRNHPPDHETLDARLASRAWSTPQTALAVGLFFLLNILASATKPFFYAYQMPTVRLVAGLAVYGVLMLFVFIITRRRGSSWGEGYGLGRRQLKFLLIAPLLYLALMPFLMLATHALQWLLGLFFEADAQLQKSAQLIAQERSWRQVCYMLIAILAAPIYEEVLFRGIFFPYLVKRLGRVWGVVLISVFFALIHNNQAAFLPLCMLSAVLCLAYWRTGSLWISIGIHASYNAVSILALLIVG